MTNRKPPSDDELQAKLREVGIKALEVFKERARAGDPEAQKELRKAAKKYGIDLDA